MYIYILNQLDWICGTVESIISRKIRLGYRTISATDFEQEGWLLKSHLQFHKFIGGSKLHIYFFKEISEKASKNSACSKHSLGVNPRNWPFSRFSRLNALEEEWPYQCLGRMAYCQGCQIAFEMQWLGNYSNSMSCESKEGPRQLPKSVGPPTRVPNQWRTGKLIVLAPSL